MWNESVNACGHCHKDILAAELDSLVFYVYNFPPDSGGSYDVWGGVCMCMCGSENERGGVEG